MKYFGGGGALNADVVVVFSDPGFSLLRDSIVDELKRCLLSTYVTTVVKVEAPRPIPRDVIESWRAPLIQELNTLEPRLILAVGEEAVQGLLNNYQPIEEVKGKSYQVTYLPAPIYVMSPYEVTSEEFDSLRQYMV